MKILPGPLRIGSRLCLLQFCMVEYIWQVDWDDNVIGKIERNECHEKKLIHRSVVVLLFNKLGELWVNRRSTKKKIFGGLLDSSVSAHVEYGETPEMCAQRELGEKLGLFDK